MPGSSRPWSKSKHIPTCLKRNFYSFARKSAWCFWHLPLWATESHLVPWETPWSRLSLHDSEEHPRRFCWLGPCSGVRRCSLPRNLPHEPARISTSAPYPKMHSMQLMGSQPGSGSTLSLTAAARASSRGELTGQANERVPQLPLLDQVWRSDVAIHPR
jgi:hypothetical protein